LLLHFAQHETTIHYPVNAMIHCKSRFFWGFDASLSHCPRANT